MNLRCFCIFLLVFSWNFSVYGQREYWLSARRGYKDGWSSSHNLYNVSTSERFDRFFARLKPNTTIHLLPGLYFTHGINAFTLPSGTKLLGSGRNKTLIRLVQYHDCSGGATVIASKQGDHDITVANLTIDSNYHKSWGKVTVRSIDLVGVRHIISNVGSIHAAGFGPECFAIAIVSPVWPAHNLIQNCRVSHYAGGWCTAIFFVAKIPESQPSPNEINVMVRNNEVFLDAPDLTRGAEGAYGGGDMQNVIFQNNYSWKATCGFNIDTGTPRNLVMENNTFSNCSGVGITIRAIQSQYYMRNVIIKNNTISLLPIGNVTYGTSIGSDHSPYPDDGTCTDVHITGNTFYCSAPIPKNAAAYSIRVYDLTRLTVVNNSIEKTIPAQLLQGFHDLTLSGNVDLGGNPFPGLQTIPVLPPSKAPVIPLPR